MTAKTRKKGKFKKQKNASLLFFILFIAIAFLTVVLLEYIDFKKGKKSFIFTKVIALEKKPPKVQQFSNRFIDILNKNNIDYEYFRDQENKYHFKLEIDAPRFSGLIARMQNVAGQLKAEVKLAEIQGLDNKSLMLYRVTINNNVTHLILVTKIKDGKIKDAKPKVTEKIPSKKEETPSPETKTEPPRHSQPRIAFIIDDIGAYDIGALELKRLNIPITASVLPDAPHAREEAHWLSQYGVPAMIHLPMQPKNGNGTYNNKKTITLGSSEEDIRSLVRRSRQIVPQAQGVNNHQGSLATSSSQVMTRTLKIIKEEGLFFVDSRTIGNTVAYDIAKRLGMSAAYKDVFIDHIKNYSHSISQIRRLVEIARYKGKAIAIGHPNPSTLKAIRDSLPYIRKKGVKIVYVSELLD